MQPVFWVWVSLLVIVGGKGCAKFRELISLMYDNDHQFMMVSLTTKGVKGFFKKGE